MLGVGGVALQGMGQGAIAAKVITPAANMYGAVIPVGFGMGIIRFVDEKGRRLQKGMRKQKTSQNYNFGRF